MSRILESTSNNSLTLGKCLSSALSPFSASTKWGNLILHLALRLDGNRNPKRSCLGKLFETTNKARRCHYCCPLWSRPNCILPVSHVPASLPLQLGTHGAGSVVREASAAIAGGKSSLTHSDSAFFLTAFSVSNSMLGSIQRLFF